MYNINNKKTFNYLGKIANNQLKKKTGINLANYTYKLENNLIPTYRKLENEESTLFLKNIKKLKSKFFIPSQDFKTKVFENIKFQFNISSYRGKRHNNGNPVRGQRTRTNRHNARKLNCHDFSEEKNKSNNTAENNNETIKESIKDA